MPPPPRNLSWPDGRVATFLMDVYGRRGRPRHAMDHLHTTVSMLRRHACHIGAKSTAAQVTLLARWALPYEALHMLRECKRKGRRFMKPAYDGVLRGLAKKADRAAFETVYTLMADDGFLPDADTFNAVLLLALEEQSAAAHTNAAKDPSQRPPPPHCASRATRSPSRTVADDAVTASGLCASPLIPSSLRRAGEGEGGSGRESDGSDNRVPADVPSALAAIAAAGVAPNALTIALAIRSCASVTTAFGLPIVGMWFGDDTAGGLWGAGRSGVPRSSHDGEGGGVGPLPPPLTTPTALHVTIEDALVSVAAGEDLRQMRAHRRSDGPSAGPNATASAAGADTSPPMMLAHTLRWIRRSRRGVYGTGTPLSPVAWAAIINAHVDAHDAARARDGHHDRVHSVPADPLTNAVACARRCLAAPETVLGVGRACEDAALQRGPLRDDDVGDNHHAHQDRWWERQYARGGGGRAAVATAGRDVSILDYKELVEVGAMGLGGDNHGGVEGTAAAAEAAARGAAHIHTGDASAVPRDARGVAKSRPTDIPPQNPGRPAESTGDTEREGSPFTGEAEVLMHAILRCCAAGVREARRRRDAGGSAKKKKKKKKNDNEGVMGDVECTLADTFDAPALIQLAEAAYTAVPAPARKMRIHEGLMDVYAAGRAAGRARALGARLINERGNGALSDAMVRGIAAAAI